MTWRDIVRFATQALGSHRLRSGLSLAGVSVGVASVILLTSLGEGARLYVVGEFASLGTNLLIVLPGRTETTGAAPLFGGTPNPVTLEDAAEIARHVPSVRRVAPMTAGAADVRHGERIREATVVGATAEMREIRDMAVRSGRFLPEGDWRRGQRVAVIGADVARDLFDGRSALGELVHVGGTRFRVIGVMDSRGMSLGTDLDQVIHVPVDQAMELFDQSGLFRVLVEVATHDDIEATKRRVTELLAERHGEEDVTVITQDSVLSAFSSILGMLTAAIGGIAAISLAVAGVAIMNVQLVSVSERTREIGLLKAIGARRRQVVAAFLVEAILLSTAGGLLGLAIGLGGVALLGALYPTFPVTPPSWAVPAALGVSVGVGVVFGALPARRAAAMDPVAALASR